MKILYLDCPTGASGNMLLAALIEAGVPRGYLIEEFDKLPLDNFFINIRKVRKKGIAASLLEVHSQSPQPHRNLNDILSLIEGSSLPGRVREKSSLVFKRLAAAEAKVHNTSVDNIHFHEVGATDALIDIIGTVLALEYLEINKIIVSPLPLGSGFVKCKHGTLPVPTPATLELIQGLMVRQSNIEAELLTPTGAAIISTLADSCGDMPSMRIDTIGYGAGTYNLPIPNILRALVGFVDESNEDIVSIIECSIDDMNPEIYPYIMEKALSAGALDILALPVIMKKGRPGNLLQVISQPEKETLLADMLLRESSTLGIRIRREKRIKLKRQTIYVATPWGDVRVKLGIHGNEIVNIAPEFEDCKAAAREHDVPIKKVFETALVEAKNLLVEEMAHKESDQ